jgi:cyanophycinase-like exopeptidase
MGGTVALVGAGEFLPAMTEIDRELLGATGRRRPRVAIIPTASFLDGEPVFQRWAAMGVEHFRNLGAEVEPVLVRDRESAEDPAAVQAVGEADLVYLSGGRPAYLSTVLRGSALGDAVVDAHGRGATVAGCSAGAMVLAEHVPSFRVRRPMLPWPLAWSRALGIVADSAVLPHYDRWPEAVLALMALQAPRGGAVIGIDEQTALVGRDGAFQVRGASRVTVWRGRHRQRFRAGEVFPL